MLYHAHLAGVHGGYVGVDVFFVISGFLITTMLWREVSAEGRLGFGRFYARRVRRLLPASVLVLVATLIASRLVLAPLVMPGVAKDALATTLYVVNYRFAATNTSYLTVATLSPFQHFWSLAVEEQFYLLWPVLLVAASVVRRRPGRPFVGRALVCVSVVGAASFGASLVLTGRSQPWAFFSLPTRAWELAIGAVLALVAPAVGKLSRPVAASVGWAGLAAIGWSAFRFTATTPFPGTAALVPVLGSAAVLIAGTRARAAGPVVLLGWAGLQRVGRLSYSWYLWHWPVLVLAAAWAGRSLRAPERVGLVLVSLGLAAATRALVEDPVRFAPSLIRRPRPTLLGGLGFTCVAALASLALVLNPPALHGSHASAATLPGLATRPLTGPVLRSKPAGVGSPATVDPGTARLSATLAPVAGALERALTTAPVPTNLEPGLRGAHGDRATPFVDGCFADFTDTAVKRCTYGARPARGTIVLFGDSHATHWFPALEPVAVAHGWRLAVLTKATCPALDAPVFSPMFGRTYRECDAWRASAIRRMSGDHPLLVVTGTNRNYGAAYHLQQYSATWLRGLDRTVRAIRATGAQVMVLGPEPLQAGDVPTCLSEHLDNEAACARPVRDAFDANGVSAERQTVTAAGGQYVDLTPWFCVPAGCPVVVGNLLVYRDQNHIATRYASWLSPLMGAKVDEVMSRATGH